MHATSSYTGEQLARAYTRDRLRDAETRRAARAVRTAAREARYVEPTAVAPARSWWRLVTRDHGSTRRLGAA